LLNTEESWCFSGSSQIWRVEKERIQGKMFS
jgi:hypothetical protein